VTPTENPAGSIPECSAESAVTGKAKVSPENPWPGLEAYDEASAEFFCGRKQEAEELLRLIHRAPLTVIYGKSGLGKTSLLQAGLFPLLRQDHFLPVMLRLDFSEGMKVAPLEQVAQRLREALDRCKADYCPMETRESLWEYLHRRDSAEFWSEDNFPLTPLLVFDQFEELFSRTGGNARIVEQVFDELADLIENRIPAELTSDAAKERRGRLDLLSQRYGVVLSFREDFLPEIRTWEKKVPSLLRNYLRLEPMSRDRAIDAVQSVGTAVLADEVAPYIVDLVGNRDSLATAAEISEMVIEPVLLSLCCTQLNLRRDPGQRIDKALVDKAGQDILESFYRDALKDPKVQGEPDVARFIEDHLIQGDRYRGDYPRDEALEENKITQKQLSALTDRLRLLRIVHRGGVARIELIHDRIVPVVSKAREQRLVEVQKKEAERKAAEAEAERDEERRRSRELMHERDVARRMRNIAVITSLVIFALAGWVWHEKRARDMAKLSREIAIETSRLAEGRLELPVGSEPLEQTMYRALATYRLSVENSELAEAKTASLTALELILASSGHLAHVLRLKGMTPTPALAYSPAGDVLAVGGDDGVIRLLNAHDFHIVGTLDCPARPKGESVWSLAFNSDGARLVSGYALGDGTSPGSGLICVFDVQQRSIIERWSTLDNGRGKANVLSVAYGGKPGSEFVLFGGSDQTLRKLDVNTRELNEVKIDDQVVAVAVNADNSQVAAGGINGVIRVWKLADLSRPDKPPMELAGHRNTVQQLVFSAADPRVLVSGGDDGRLMAWNTEEGCRTQESAIQEARIYGVALTPKGDMLASAGEDGYVRLFWLADDELTCEKPESPSGQSIQPKIKLVQPEGVLAGHGGLTLAVAFDNQGKHLASAGQDGSVRIWMRSTGSFSQERLELDAGGLGSLTSVAVSPNGKYVAAGDDGGYVHVWKLTNPGEPVREPVFKQWNAHDAAIRCLIYALVDHQLMLITGGDDGSVKRWDPIHQKIIGAPTNNGTSPVVSIALSPDGKTLAAGSENGTISLWDAATGKPVRAPIPAPKDHPYYKLRAIGFSNDGDYIAAGSDLYTDLRVVNLNDGSERWLQGHTTGISSLSHGEHEWLLSSGSDGTVMEWGKEAVLMPPAAGGLRKRDEFKYRTGSPELRHPQALTAMAASSDGDLILAGGKEGEIQLWDGREHVLISDNFAGHQQDIRAVAVAPHNGFFVTADANTVLVWPGPDRWADILCSKLMWNMSHSHWRDWVSSQIAYTDQCPGLKEEPSETPKAGQ